MSVAIIDYGMGNQGSVRRALDELGCAPFVAESPGDLAHADRIVLPGVGSFGDGMRHLTEGGWIEALRGEISCGKPLLGICLGMQLLAQHGTEGTPTEGLGFISGEVVRLDTLGCTLRVPHVGWNSLTCCSTTSNLLNGIPSGTDFYFVHSFAFRAPEANLLATADYGIEFAAVVSNGQRVFGTQFHPEKSSKAGFRLLQNFLDIPSC